MRLTSSSKVLKPVTNIRKRESGTDGTTLAMLRVCA